MDARCAFDNKTILKPVSGGQKQNHTMLNEVSEPGVAGSTQKRRARFANDATAADADEEIGQSRPTAAAYSFNFVEIQNELLLLCTAPIRCINVVIAKTFRAFLSSAGRSNFYWALSLVSFILGWWAWIYGIVLSNYYHLYVADMPSLAPFNATISTSAMSPTTLAAILTRPSAIRSHFPMRLFHMIPGVFISFAFFFLCIPYHDEYDAEDMGSSVFDESPPPCTPQRVRTGGMLIFSICGCMICLLWITLIFVFGDIDLGMTFLSDRRTRDEFAEDNVYLVTASALFVQCSLLVCSLASAAMASRLRHRERRGSSMGAFDF